MLFFRELCDELTAKIPQSVGATQMHGGCRPLLGVGLGAFRPKSLAKSDGISMNYVTKDQWDHPKNENRAQRYIEDRMGAPVHGRVATKDRVYGTQLLKCLFHTGPAPSKFTDLSEQAMGFIYYNMVSVIPELADCDDGTWKIDILIQGSYPLFAKVHGLTDASQQDTDRLFRGLYLVLGQLTTLVAGLPTSANMIPLAPGDTNKQEHTDVVSLLYFLLELSILRIWLLSLGASGLAYHDIFGRDILAHDNCCRGMLSAPASNETPPSPAPSTTIGEPSSAPAPMDAATPSSHSSESLAALGTAPSAFETSLATADEPRCA